MHTVIVLHCSVRLVGLRVTRVRLRCKIGTFWSSGLKVYLKKKKRNEKSFQMNDIEHSKTMIFFSLFYEKLGKNVS